MTVTRIVAFERPRESDFDHIFSVFVIKCQTVLAIIVIFKRGKNNNNCKLSTVASKQ